ncbi:hypothetical protein BCR33DRAFT_713231 [Rhizoclosmatium globosum]|uniref:Trichome birefringence-like C-terminal domain-containing protein n=1 Tax=Rhizoclosmatium globosum TaxID=329046 RepID=A0A1Y2CVR0_9FUNG|nr:hypothetical protein BCR33DRAFT_713231 [Rhizoclosmatium globosum]|eukprot:ORY50425.1 hypothetical protein BCR33DRAFT_713231 [Rhizoclosmatium globosum]
MNRGRKLLLASIIVALLVLFQLNSVLRRTIWTDPQSPRTMWKHTTSNQSDYIAAYRTCPLLADQDLCALPRLESIASWKLSLQLPDITSLQDSCLAGQTIGISGDSISRQSFRSLVCLFHAHGYNVSLSESETTATISSNAYPRKKLLTILWTSDKLNPYLIAFEGKRPSPTLKKGLHPSLQSLLSKHKLNHLILNTGLWLDPSSFSDRKNPITGSPETWLTEYKKAITETINALTTTDTLRSQKTKITFRNTPFRHFKTVAGSSNPLGGCPNARDDVRDGWGPSFNSSARDYPLSYAEIQLNVLLEEFILEAKRRHPTLKWEEVLDAASIAEHREDAHTSFTDCAHYCLPGVPDAWNMIWLARYWDSC